MNEIYGKNGKMHHVWCNFANTDGRCKQCDRLYREYPLTDDPISMIETYFPDVTVIAQDSKKS